MIKKIFLSIRYRLSRCIPTPNEKLRKSNWYHNVFNHLREYERLKQGADLICIGSTPAKHALDFNNINGICGYNLAVCPETIFYDFQVLKNYHSYLKPGGTILFVLCPFTFLKDFYRNEYGSDSYLNVRYYPILHRAMIDTFDYNIYRKWVKYPILLGPRVWKRLIKDSKQSNFLKENINPNTQEESETLCKKRLKAWMREFGMIDLDPKHIPKQTNDVIKGNIRIFQEMKTFIEERGYKAYIVIPPFPIEMRNLLPQVLIEHNLLEPIRKTGYCCLNYYNDETFSKHEYYHHGFLLNAKGRELFTATVLSRILLL